MSDTPDYGEAPAHTGLTLSMGPIPDPVPLEADAIVWPHGYPPHHGTHQFDRAAPTQDGRRNEAA